MTKLPPPARRPTCSRNPSKLTPPVPFDDAWKGKIHLSVEQMLVNVFLVF